MTPEAAEVLIEKDPRNKDVLFPYVNGQDLNNNVGSAASRWVINFYDWPEEKARSYTDCFGRVVQLVKPERRRKKPNGEYVLRKPLPERYWQYAEKQPAMVQAIARFDRVIVMARISKVVMPVMVKKGPVFNEKTVIFATDDTAMLALLSSAFHYWWAITRSSTIKADLNYSPTDVFETFARPELTQELRDLGDRLDTFRRDLMLARQAGLTKTYNLVHDAACTDADIAELRSIHREIDYAVARAYGWDDLVAQGLDHGFHDTRQGPRYTVGPVVRQEILDRLLELNHERYAAEQAANSTKPSKPAPSAPSAESGTLF